MTTREQIIGLRNECDEFAEQTLKCTGEFHPDFHTVSDERFYNIAHEAGVASRDAEIAQLNKEAAEKFSALAKEYDQLRAELEYDQRNAAMSQRESARLLDENTKLRAELAAALAACKAKDEAMLFAHNNLPKIGHIPDCLDPYLEKAIAIQPDDSALKAWLGAPVAWEFTDAFGTHYTDDQRDWMDTPGIESVTCLYSPKGLK